MTAAKAVNVPGMLHSQVGKPERVAFGSLNLSPKRFQVRNAEALSHVQRFLKEREAKELLTSLFKTLETGVTLDPPIIWLDSTGTRWVIDGHHRMEAMTEAGTDAEAKVWVQRFKGATEAEARAFAHEVNKKDHLNMHPGEALNSYWRMLLCDEIVGSVRGRAKAYGVGISTVSRMDKEKPVVLAQLKKEADAAGERFDSMFILTNGPTWKDRSQWREGLGRAPTDSESRAPVDRLLKALAIRFADVAKAQPNLLLQAFKEFFWDATGQAIKLSREVPEDEDSDF